MAVSDSHFPRRIGFSVIFSKSSVFCSLKTNTASAAAAASVGSGWQASWEASWEEKAAAAQPAGQGRQAARSPEGRARKEDAGARFV